ncbi:hypothetical protein A359_09280 [secondary endosymbiont of Ctenarytaina eucalypti]|uniref:Uncharacterized protein n=1 Tax=secondary endosymbiont of Ctenarytaina eucalypti TaxID=1199245 RepID=J3TG18_9ENTR|nr:hypothetical protein A359_09280 [secondary endosymbiont of Ctenarytaina eucalypti]
MIHVIKRISKSLIVIKNYNHLFFTNKYACKKYELLALCINELAIVLHS